jgi:CBS domain-containing protein
MAATVRDVMTTKVVAMRDDASFKQVVSVLRQYRISACPVVNERNQVMGIVSEADVLCKIAAPDLPSGLSPLRWQLASESKENATTAAGLMTTPAVVVRPDTPIAAAARMMQDRKIRRLPVVDQQHRLIGIISRADFLAVYERPDAEIAADIRDDIIAGEFGLDPAAIDVSVGSGVVTLTGNISSAQLGARLLGRVSHADGVVAVRDRLTVTDEPSETSGSNNESPTTEIIVLGSSADKAESASGHWVGSDRTRDADSHDTAGLPPNPREGP